LGNPLSLASAPLDPYILSHLAPFVKNYFYYFLSTHPRVSRARAMSAICGHRHSFFDNLAILFDKSNIAIVAPKFVFVVTINKLILVQEFFATVGTKEVLDVHFLITSLSICIVSQFCQFVKH
jgi:hypothetical protein